MSTELDSVLKKYMARHATLLANLSRLNIKEMLEMQRISLKLNEIRGKRGPLNGENKSTKPPRRSTSAYVTVTGTSRKPGSRRGTR